MAEFKNLHNPRGVKQDGWASQDFARDLLDGINQQIERSGIGKPWKYEDVFKGQYHPYQDATSFGYLLGAAWFCGAISGGKLREIIKKAHTTDQVDGLMAQRLLEHCEQLQKWEDNKE